MIQSFSLVVASLVIAGEKSLADAQRTLIWADEFNSGTEPNNEYWNYDLGSGSPHGWGNYELQRYTNSSSNVRVEDGNLKIIVNQDPSTGEFTSGRISTENKMEFQYGTVEALIRVPNVANGLWPAFWTLGSNFDTVGFPASGEVDIMEMGQGLAIAEGVVNRRVVSAAHWEIDGTYATYALWHDSDVDLHMSYHLFRLEWTPDVLRTFVDEHQIWEMNISPEACLGCEELHQPHYIILNVAVGGGFTYSSLNSGASSSSSSSSSSSLLGCPDSSSSSSSASSSSASGTACYRPADQITAPLPAEMAVDWVRIYNNGDTTVNGNVLQPTSEPTLVQRPSLAPALAVLRPLPTPRPVAPTAPPTALPTKTPTSQPTTRPTMPPTPFPVAPPTVRPTIPPTNFPTMPPTPFPVALPTTRPTVPPVPQIPIPIPTAPPSVNVGTRPPRPPSVLVSLPPVYTDLQLDQNLTVQVDTPDAELVVKEAKEGKFGKGGKGKGGKGFKKSKKSKESKIGKGGKGGKGGFAKSKEGKQGELYYAKSKTGKEGKLGKGGKGGKGGLFDKQSKEVIGSTTSKQSKIGNGGSGALDFSKRSKTRGSKTGKEITIGTKDSITTPAANPLTTPAANPLTTPAASPFGTPVASPLDGEVEDGELQLEFRMGGADQTERSQTDTGVLPLEPLTEPEPQLSFLLDSNNVDSSSGETFSLGILKIILTVVLSVSLIIS